MDIGVFIEAIGWPLLKSLHGINALWAQEMLTVAPMLFAYTIFQGKVRLLGVPERRLNTCLTPSTTDVVNTVLLTCLT